MFSIFFMCVLFILFLQFPRHSHWRKIVNLRNRPEFEHSFHEIRELWKTAKLRLPLKTTIIITENSRTGATCITLVPYLHLQRPSRFIWTVWYNDPFQFLFCIQTITASNGIMILIYIRTRVMINLFLCFWKAENVLWANQLPYKERSDYSR